MHEAVYLTLVCKTTCCRYIYFVNCILIFPYFHLFVSYWISENAKLYIHIVSIMHWITILILTLTGLSQCQYSKGRRKKKRKKIYNHPGRKLRSPSISLQQTYTLLVKVFFCCKEDSWETQLFLTDGILNVTIVLNENWCKNGLVQHIVESSFLCSDEIGQKTAFLQAGK